MSVLIKYIDFRISCITTYYIRHLNRPHQRCSSTDSKETEEGSEEFRVLKLFPDTQDGDWKKSVQRKEIPRLEERYKNVQDWTNVWVGPKSFLPDVVPLPVRQGYNKDGAPYSKYGNAELMKIPNFLHLTPPAIKKHCEALKKFCTKWPETLKSDEDMDAHFPVTVIASDYCHSLPTIRDPLSRIINVKVKLSALELDKHAKDKLLRLLGSRYDCKSDCFTLTTQNCPLKKQNYDYAMYLLTALYYESWKREEWENEKMEDDMEEYIFQDRQEKRNLDCYFAYNNKSVPDTRKLATIVERYMMEGETWSIVCQLKKEIVEVLKLPEFRT